MHSEKESKEVLDAALKAWNNGRGEWPQMTSRERIERVEQFANLLKEKKDEIATLLMWEICKNKADSEKEVTRTIQYINDTIQECKSMENRDSKFTENGGIVAQVRRAPFGVVLCSGPFNYPFNESYALLIPALIMGCPVIMKLPRVGILCHQPTFALFHCVPSTFPARKAALAG